MLPVGLSFMAGAYSEPTLIKLAYGFEAVTKARRAPTYIPTLPLPKGINPFTGKAVTPAIRFERMVEKLRTRPALRSILRNL